jgi:hypothetical protein
VNGYLYLNRQGKASSYKNFLAKKANRDKHAQERILGGDGLVKIKIVGG